MFEFEDDNVRQKYYRLVKAVHEKTDEIPCTKEDPDLYTESWADSSNLSAHKAAKLCDGCPVKDLCLDYAISNNETHGVWGGQTPRDRKKLRKQREQ